MALIVDYSSLGQAIQDFCHRSDVASYQDYFIQGAQEKINADVLAANFGNGIYPMEETFAPTAISSNGTIAIPNDWMAPKDFQGQDAAGNIWTLSFKDTAWMYDNYPVRQPDALPAYIARDGTNFVFGPYPDQSYSVQGTYYGIAPLLSKSNTTNWIVDAAPMMFHAYCMVEAGKFLKDAQMAQSWQAVANDKLTALINQDKAERFSGATLAIELG